MKKLIALALAICAAFGLVLPASALEYTIDAPPAPCFGKPTSIERTVTADRGERPNVDLSKDTAVLPPAFGTAAWDDVLVADSIGGEIASAAALAYTNYTAVAAAMVNADGSIGTLSIPSLGVSAKVYEGTDLSTLAKGVGHFTETSIYGGNVCIAGHNRGANDYFGDIHTLNVGDAITLTTTLGAKTYSVTSVSKIEYTDGSVLSNTAESCITLITCVSGQPTHRWCVRAMEVR
mgnify:CR=1 FL=1